MMKPFTVLLLLFLIVLLALAVPSVVVQAQEAEVTPDVISAITPTSGAGGWFELTPEQYTLMSEDTVEGILFILKAMLVLFAGMVIALFQSAPPWLKPFLISVYQTGRERIIEPIGKYVESTERTSDDVQYADFISRLNALETSVGIREPAAGLPDGGKWVWVTDEGVPISGTTASGSITPVFHIPPDDGTPKG